MATNFLARHARPTLAALAMLAACQGDSSNSVLPPPPPSPPTILGAQVSTFLIDPARPEVVHFEAFVAGTPTRVEFALQDQPLAGLPMSAGERVVVPIPGGSREAVVWRADVPSDQLLVRPRRVGMMAQIGGPSAVAANGAKTFFSLRLWVRDAGVAPVAVSQLAPDVQASTHVVNVRDDALATGFKGAPNNAVVNRFEAWAPAIRRFYNFFPDDYDYVVIIPPLDLATPAAGEHLGYRNTTDGIGQAPFDLSGRVAFGSASRLQSVIYFGEATLADFAASTFSHELAHRWMVRLTEREFAFASSHWPISDLAYGLMGFEAPGVSGRFPFQIDQVDTNRFRYRRRTQAQTFNSIELYLMGLLPASAVTDTFRLFTGSILNPADGVEFDAVTRSFTIDSLIAMVGQRRPSAAVAPTQFRVATIVITRGRLLSAAEMALFDMLAARGEAQSALPPITETADGSAPTVLPLYEATGHRGTVITTLRP